MSNQIPGPDGELGRAIKNGNSNRAETSTVDNCETNTIETVMNNQNVTKNTNVTSTSEITDSMKNGNNDIPKNGNVVKPNISVLKNGNNSLDEPIVMENTTKNANDQIPDHDPEPKIENVTISGLDTNTTNVITSDKDSGDQSSLDNRVNNILSTNDDSDDDTVIYTSDPECDQMRTTDSADSVSTKPRISHQISIKLNRLTKDEISSWQAKDQPAKDDPLSALERCSDNPKTTDSLKQRRHISSRRKSNRKKSKSKQDLWYEDTELDIPPSPKRKRCVYIGLKGPSSARIRSQYRTTELPAQKIPVDYRSPSSETEKEDEPGEPLNAVDTGTQPVANVNSNPETAKEKAVNTSDNGTEQQAPVPPKGTFHNQTHGIVIHKRVRTYKCSVCSTVSNTQSAANAHFKNNHPPVQCSKCAKTCSTGRIQLIRNVLSATFLFE